MGLDSVELLMDVEDSFNIQIPDSESEQINTVQDFADSVYQKISIVESNKCLSQRLFYNLKNTFQEVEINNNSITPNTRIKELLLDADNLKSKWTELQKQLSLRLPKLVPLDYNPSLNPHRQLFGIQFGRRTPAITNATIRQLVDWIISLNYQQLIKKNEISSKYEVERIICGIISDKMGIAINKIEMNHSINSDLGID